MNAAHHERVTAAVRRRWERRLRTWTSHEQVSTATSLAEALHHITYRKGDEEGGGEAKAGSRLLNLGGRDAESVMESSMSAGLLVPCDAPELERGDDGLFLAISSGWLRDAVPKRVDAAPSGGTHDSSSAVRGSVESTSGPSGVDGEPSSGEVPILRLFLDTSELVVQSVTGVSGVSTMCCWSWQHCGTWSVGADALHDGTSLAFKGEQILRQVTWRHPSPQEPPRSGVTLQTSSPQASGYWLLRSGPSWPAFVGRPVPRYLMGSCQCGLGWSRIVGSTWHGRGCG